LIGSFPGRSTGSGKIPTVQHWDLLAVDAPRGTRDPLVVHQDEGARAVLVVLEPGQALGEHQVKENAWVTIIDGSVEVASGDETVTLSRGGLLRFEPGERHSLSSSTGARILMVLAPWPGAGHYRSE
jgi:quercetin dioxygenase-like cupin family protein